MLDLIYINGLIYELVHRYIGFDDDQIGEILNGDSLFDGYQKGKFCSLCPSFNQCTNPPALKARGIFSCRIRRQYPVGVLLLTVSLHTKVIEFVEPYDDDQ